jgi:hypothetical protein
MLNIGQETLEKKTAEQVNRDCNRIWPTSLELKTEFRYTEAPPTLINVGLVQMRLSARIRHFAKQEQGRLRDLCLSAWGQVN